MSSPTDELKASPKKTTLNTKERKRHARFLLGPDGQEELDSETEDPASEGTTAISKQPSPHSDLDPVTVDTLEAPPDGAVPPLDAKETYPPAKHVNDSSNCSTEPEAPTKEKTTRQRIASSISGWIQRKNAFLEPIYTKYLPKIGLGWAVPHLTIKGFRPVVRATLTVWVAFLIVLSDANRSLGNSPWLMLVVGTISPFAFPIATQLEKVLLQTFWTTLGWAWACLGLFCAHEARVKYKYTQEEFTEILKTRHSASLSPREYALAVEEDVFRGTWLETKSSVVIAVFLATGCAYYLWLRARWGPSASLFGLIFGCIITSTTLTYGAMFPYPNYLLGKAFMIPYLAVEAIGLACTFLIFPETIVHQYCDHFIATLQPLQRVIRDQDSLLSTNPRSAEWVEHAHIKDDVRKALGTMAFLINGEKNLGREMGYARMGGRDVRKILSPLRALVNRSSGFVTFYDIVEQHLHRNNESTSDPVDQLVIHICDPKASPSRPSTSHNSRPASLALERKASEFEDSRGRSAHRPSSIHSNADHRGSSAKRVPLKRNKSTPTVSRNPSITSLADVTEGQQLEVTYSRPKAAHDPLSDDRETDLDERESDTGRDSRSRRWSRDRRMGRKSNSLLALPGLLQEALYPDIPLRPVGLAESQQYMDLEDYLNNPSDEEHIAEIIALLHDASGDVIKVLDKSIEHLVKVIQDLKTNDTLWNLAFGTTTDHDALVKKSAEGLARLTEVVHEYRYVSRMKVIVPFAPLFDPTVASDETYKFPSHRGLYWALNYQNTLLEWGKYLIRVYTEIIEIEKKRKKPRFWAPDWRAFRLSNTYTEENIVGLDTRKPSDLIGFSQDIPGFKKKSFKAPRHPDYVPPTSRIQLLGIKLYELSQILWRSDVLFAIKVFCLVCSLSLPIYFRSTTFFYYQNRGIWVLIMAIMSSTPSVGETTFGLIVRLIGTFGGALVGLMVWYIGSGNGHGSPHGLGAISAPVFLLIMFHRVYFTPPIAAIFPAVTAFVIIGFSWQDANYPNLNNAHFGFEVAWTRMLCVMMGILAAYIVALLPPKITQKANIRQTYGNVIGEIGTIIAQTISFAIVKPGKTPAPKQIIRNIAALRTRIASQKSKLHSIPYEFSLRGRWPSETYDALQSLQLEILDQLSLLLSVLANLEQNWTKALLQRCQLTNTRFVAEMLNTIQLISNSLSSAEGQPLPMVYSPLLEGFLRPPETLISGHIYGYNITMDEEIEGIPNVVDLDTICSIEYLRFSAGASSVYSIVNRLDRLMLIAKSLVGENYIVYGLVNERTRLLDDQESDDEDYSKPNDVDANHYHLSPSGTPTNSTFSPGLFPPTTTPTTTPIRPSIYRNRTSSPGKRLFKPTSTPSQVVGGLAGYRSPLSRTRPIGISPVEHKGLGVQVARRNLGIGTHSGLNRGRSPIRRGYEQTWDGDSSARNSLEDGR